MKIQNINFKKAFIALFAAFLVFTVVSASVELSDGRWNDAVAYEQHRYDTNQGRARFGRQHERDGRFGRSSHRHSAISETNFEQTEAANTQVAPPRSTGDRVIYSVARHYVRVASSDFDVLTLLGSLLKVALVVLLTLWVYTDSKKHERSTLFWTGLTLVTYGIGWVVYMIMRERRKGDVKLNVN